MSPCIDFQSMNVTVSVECFQMLTKMFKFPLCNGFTKEVDQILQLCWRAVRLISSLLCWYTEFIRPHETTFRFTFIDLYKINTVVKRPFYFFIQVSTAVFSITRRTLHLYCFSFFFCCCYGWISPRIVPKNSDRNIKCPGVSARACYPSRCTPVSSDERQPPNMWQGRGLCRKWFGNAQYIQFSTAYLFSDLKTRYPFAMLIYCV